MSQSLSEVILHVVFSTKDRYPFITEKWKLRLHAYLATLARDHGWKCMRVGGVSDHVHLALKQPRTENISDLVGHIKRQSTLWLKKEGLEKFKWQRGFGVFSVSPPHVPNLLAYIDQQEEHHRHVSFQDEYISFLKKYKVEYDENYLWD